jgi:hypothetical protein
MLTFIGADTLEETKPCNRHQRRQKHSFQEYAATEIRDQGFHARLHDAQRLSQSLIEIVLGGVISNTEGMSQCNPSYGAYLPYMVCSQGTVTLLVAVQYLD